MAGPLAHVEVALPARGRGGQGTRATVSVSPAGGAAAEGDGPEGGVERAEVPVEVGRRLVSALGAAEAECEPARLRELLAQAMDACCRARVESLVGRRDYCARELAERLLSYGYPREVVDERVGRAAASGAIDDARYARSLVRSKAAAGWGRSRIERELERRGVAREVASAAAEEELGGEDERSRALAVASRRRLTGRDDVARIARFLCGRGFSPGVAFDVAREVAGS